MGITQIDTGAGLTGGPITDSGTIALAAHLRRCRHLGESLEHHDQRLWSDHRDRRRRRYDCARDQRHQRHSITSSGATIIWTTDDFSDSQVEYGTTTSYGTSTTLDTTPVTSHSVPITGTARIDALSLPRQVTEYCWIADYLRR